MRISPPERLPRFLRLGALAVAVGLAASACKEDPGVTITRSTPTSYDAGIPSPEAVGTPLPPRTPEELTTLLLGSREPLPGLPPAKYALEATEFATAAPGMPKSARGVRYIIDGPDLENSVTYWLYASAADAHADWATLLEGHDFPPERLDGLGGGYPGRVFNNLSPARDVGTTRVYVLAGQTIIEVVSSVAQQSPFGNVENATELTQIALAHLLAVNPP